MSETHPECRSEVTCDQKQKSGSGVGPVPAVPSPFKSDLWRAVTFSVLTFCVALIIVYVPKDVDFSENYFLFYIVHFTCSVIIPCLYFITHPKSLKDSISEARDMLF